jgi:lipoprotein-anchoring transpeptidase ErfK/SrfK
VTTFLKIKRKTRRAILFKQGQRVWVARIGIGKAGTETPPGNFYVREKLLPRDPGGIYGVFAFGTSATSPTLTDWPGGGIIGIHGTNQPGLIPGRISHGCIRVRNKAISQLRRLMPLGTPIQIL